MKYSTRAHITCFALNLAANATGTHASVISNLLQTPLGSPSLAAQVAMAPFQELNQPPAHIEQVQDATNTVALEAKVFAAAIQASQTTVPAHHGTAATLDSAIGVRAEMRDAPRSSGASPSRNSDLTPIAYDAHNHLHDRSGMISSRLRYASLQEKSGFCADEESVTSYQKMSVLGFFPLNACYQPAA